MSITRSYLLLLGLLLVGYTFLGKGFAYLGFAPIYVGETVLALGFLVFLLGGVAVAIIRSSVTWFILAFAAWGAIRTIPYVGTYGLDALRDGVVWAYSAFALLVTSFMLRTKLFKAVLNKYGRLLPYFLVWVPVAWTISGQMAEAIPRAPGSEIPLVFFKGGDVGVHLAGAAVFLSLALHHSFPQRTGSSVWAKEWVWWIAWLMGFLIVSIGNRGGFLSMLTAIGVMFLLRPVARIGKVLFIITILLFVLVAFNIEFDWGSRRMFSVQQFMSNVSSIFTTSDAALEGTKRWRLVWWGDIIDYTIFGDYFWTGKGYGINLADADGFQAKQDTSLRSPHSAHMTILARSGVPGLVLWILVQTTFAITLLRAYIRALRGGHSVLANVNLWVLAYWTAFIVNMSFDVYLEGPQGGIWFWCLIGFGIALVEVQRNHGSRRHPKIEQYTPSGVSRGRY